MKRPSPRRARGRSGINLSWDEHCLRFDDRLQTMLDAPVADSRDRAVRWRQLVDLLARVDSHLLSEAAEQALEVVRKDAFAIDESVRAATVRAIAGRPVPPALLRILAAQPVRIAALSPTRGLRVATHRHRRRTRWR